MGGPKRWSVVGAAVLQTSVLLVGVPSVGAAGAVNPCGPREVWLEPSAISQLPDGGQIDTYMSGTVTYQVPVPPKNFSPTTASAADLATYGFPARPDGSSQLAAWNDDLATWRWTADSGLCETNTRAATDPNTNWAGYRADVTSTLFIAVQGDYHQAVKGTTSCSNPYEASWVGIGGAYGLNSGLIQDGTGIDPNGSLYAWYEYLYFDSSGNFHGINLTKMPSVIVHGGDRMHSYVVHQTSGAGQTTFYVADNTTGTSKSVIVNLAAAYYDGRTAEWIDERLTVGGSLAPLTNFGHIDWTNTKAQRSNTTWYNLGSLSYTKEDITIPEAIAYPNALSSSTTFTDWWYNCS